MKNIILTLLITFWASLLFSQNIDKERMHRDIEVAEKALLTLLDGGNQNSNAIWLNAGRNIEGEFVKDYGVVFHVKGPSSFENVAFVKGLKIQKNQKEKQDKEAVIVDETDNGSGLFIDASTTFLSDYAGIIGQLSDKHKVMIRRSAINDYSDTHFEDVYLIKSENESDEQSIVDWKSKNDEQVEISLEIGVSDLNAYRRGSFSREDLMGKVKITKNLISNKKDPDLETLSAMFHRLYQSDLSTTYYAQRKPSYTKLSNFGTIMKMKVYSSIENETGVFSMPTISAKNLTLEERTKKVAELLPKFESEFKENLINYGRTLKDLEKDEILMFEVNMTTCKECENFPKTMKFSVKKSVLKKYNRGDLDLKGALGMISVERL